MDTEGIRSPSLSEYARFHGLAIDHRTNGFLGDLTTILHPETLQHDLTDLPSFLPPPIKDVLTEPRFQLNSRERTLLISSITAPVVPSWEDVLPRSHRVASLKLEIPLLTSDHAAELRNFTERPSLDLNDLNVLLEPVDHDNNEDVSWPSKYIGFAAEWDAKPLQERLLTTKRAVTYLQTALQDTYTPELHKAILDEALSYVKASRSFSINFRLTFH